MQKRILMIDDDKDYIEAVARMLETEGFEVLQAHNGKEGILLAGQEKPDLVLLDVMMAEPTEGFDIARTLHKQGGEGKIPVILITGIRREYNLPFGFERDDEFLPVEAVLEKPVKPEQLIKTIEGVFGNAPHS